MKYYPIIKRKPFSEKQENATYFHSQFCFNYWEIIEAFRRNQKFDRNLRSP